MIFLSFLCTKWMENCEAMTSYNSFAYSYRLVKKCFLKICETSKCHNFLIFQPIFIRFLLLCLKIFTLSSKIKLILLWSSSLNRRGAKRLWRTWRPRSVKALYTVGVQCPGSSRVLDALSCYLCLTLKNSDVKRDTKIIPVDPNLEGRAPVAPPSGSATGWFKVTGA